MQTSPLNPALADLALGVLMAFLGLLGNVIAPLGNLSEITQAMQQATGGM